MASAVPYFLSPTSGYLSVLGRQYHCSHLHGFRSFPFARSQIVPIRTVSNGDCGLPSASSHSAVKWNPGDVLTRRARAQYEGRAVGLEPANTFNRTALFTCAIQGGLEQTGYRGHRIPGEPIESHKTHGGSPRSLRSAGGAREGPDLQPHFSGLEISACVLQTTPRRPRNPRHCLWSSR
jgi:hypothetical protein